MKKEVKEFIDQLVDYVNKYIVGTPTTYITGCQAVDQEMNRGHAIPFQVAMPDDIEGLDESMMLGPCFYAEELMDAQPGASIAAIAEMVNADVNKWYGDMVALMKAQMEAMNKTLDDYKDDIILTAVPIERAADAGVNEDFITKEFPELGIVATMKGLIHNASDGLSYFTPIMKGSHDATEAEWKKAEQNSLNEANIVINAIPVPDGQRLIPVAGQITDTKGFFDYFYLLSTEVWKPLVEDLKADRIYIVPFGAYAARFIIDSPDTRKCKMAKAMTEAFRNGGIKNAGNLLALVLDTATMKFTRWEATEDEDQLNTGKRG